MKNNIKKFFSNPSKLIFNIIDGIIETPIIYGYSLLFISLAIPILTGTKSFTITLLFSILGISILLILYSLWPGQEKFSESHKQNRLHIEKYYQTWNPERIELRPNT